MEILEKIGDYVRTFPENEDWIKLKGAERRNFQPQPVNLTERERLELMEVLLDARRWSQLGFLVEENILYIDGIEDNEHKFFVEILEENNGRFPLALLYYRRFVIDGVIPYLVVQDIYNDNDMRITLVFDYEAEQFLLLLDLKVRYENEPLLFTNVLVFSHSLFQF